MRATGSRNVSSATLPLLRFVEEADRLPQPFSCEQISVCAVEAQRARPYGRASSAGRCRLKTEDCGPPGTRLALRHGDRRGGVLVSEARTQLAALPR